MMSPPTSHYQQVSSDPTPYKTQNGSLTENDASHLRFPVRLPHFGPSQHRVLTDSSMSSSSTGRTWDSGSQSFASSQTFEAPWGLEEVSNEAVEFHGNPHLPPTFQGNLDEVSNERNDEHESFLSKMVNRDSESALDGRSEEAGMTEPRDVQASNPLTADTELPLNASDGPSPCGVIDINFKDSEIDMTSERCLPSTLRLNP
jgi:hypothetical protein